MQTLAAVRLERANLGAIDRAGHAQQPAPELGRRLLEQIAAGAVLADRTVSLWARDPRVRDTAGNYLNPEQRATANAALDMLADWISSGAVAYAPGPDIDGMYHLELRGPGQALLARLWDIPEDVAP